MPVQELWSKNGKVAKVLLKQYQHNRPGGMITKLLNFEGLADNFPNNQIQ